MAECAVVLVGLVAQRQHRVLQLWKLQRLWHYPAQEGERMIRRIPFTGGGGDKQGLATAGEQRSINLVDGAQAGLVPGSAQMRGGALCQLLCKASLAGPCHQDRRFIAVAVVVIALAGTPPQREAGCGIDHQRCQRHPPLRCQWCGRPPAFAQMQAQQQ